MSDRSHELGVDPELLAAFLEGKLDAAAREAVLARVATSDDDLGILANAAAVLANADATEHIDTAVDEGKFRLRRNKWIVVGLAAAVLLLSITVWKFTGASLNTPERTSIVELASNIAPSAQPRSWSDDSWAVTRGPYNGGTERARAARVGALLVDVGVARSTSDSSQARLIGELARLLESYPAGSVASAAARSLLSSANGQTGASTFTDVVLAAAGLASPDQLNTGAALEAARLAALGHDMQFFRSGKAVNAVSVAAVDDIIAANARDEFVRLQAEADNGSVDWTGASSKLTELLRALVE